MFLFFTAILLLNNMFIDYYLTSRTEDLIVNVIVPDVIHPYDDVPIILVVTNNGKESVGIRNPSYYWNFHPRLYHDDVLINSFGIRVKPDPKAKKIIETIAPGETREYLLPHSFNALFNTVSSSRRCSVFFRGLSGWGFYAVLGLSATRSSIRKKSQSPQLRNSSFWTYLYNRGYAQVHPLHRKVLNILLRGTLVRLHGRLLILQGRQWLQMVPFHYTGLVHLPLLQRVMWTDPRLSVLVCWKGDSLDSFWDITKMALLESDTGLSINDLSVRLGYDYSFRPDDSSSLERGRGFATLMH